MLITAWLGLGDSTLPTTVAATPAGKPMAPPRTLGSVHAPASASRIASAAAPSPPSRPAATPQAVMRFHQIDRTRTGNAAEALHVRDQRKSLSGSACPAVASQAVTRAIPSRAIRATPTRVRSGTG